MKNIRNRMYFIASSYWELRILWMACSN
jgi:hypothetical protein